MDGCQGPTIGNRGSSSHSRRRFPLIQGSAGPECRTLADPLVYRPSSTIQIHPYNYGHRGCRLGRSRHWVLYEPMAVTGDYGWKLRVAGALLSLDAIEPYLEEICRFRRSDAPRFRALSRQYLERGGASDDGAIGPVETD